MLNEKLLSFLNAEAKVGCPDEKKNIQNVIKSIKKCPIEITYEDSLDLIGVTKYIEGILKSFFDGKTHIEIPESKIERKIILKMFSSSKPLLSKSEIISMCDLAQKNINKFRPKKIYSDKWKYFKKLEVKGCVERSGHPPLFSLTELGINIAKILQGEPHEVVDNDIDLPDIEMVVSQSDIHERTSVDVIDSVRRTGIKWSEKDIPIGSIWIVRKNQVFDYIIQFSSFSTLTNSSLLRNLNSTSFSKKIVIVPSKESSNHTAFKIRASFDYYVDIHFLETTAFIARFLVDLITTISIKGKPIGMVDDIVALNQSGNITTTIGDIWKLQLLRIPGCGPQMVSSIVSVFRTPNSLYQFVKDATNPIEDFCNSVAINGGRKPPPYTASILIKLFGCQDCV